MVMTMMNDLLRILLNGDNDSNNGPLSSIVTITGCATIVFASALTYVLWKTRSVRRIQSDSNKDEDVTTGKTSKVTVDKTKYPGGEIYVYYGTQTGTSESFARELEREGPTHGFYIHVVDLEDIQLEDIVAESRLQEEENHHRRTRGIFLMATYGEGEPTDNSNEIYHSMKERAGLHSDSSDSLDDKTNDHDLIEKLSSTTTTTNTNKENESSNNNNNNNNNSNNKSCQDGCLTALDYCVFGLGNREYDHYNFIGKFFDTILERLGGCRIVDLGLGDDNQDLEGDFEKWKDQQLWPTLKKLYIHDQETLLRMKHGLGSSSSNKNNQNALQQDCKYKVIYHNDPVNGTIDKQPSSSSPPDRDTIPLDTVHGSSRHFFASVDCPISAMYELRSADDPGSTMHIEIDISEAKKKKVRYGKDHQHHHQHQHQQQDHHDDLVSYMTADNFAILPKNQDEDVEAIAKAFGYDLNAQFSLQAADNHDWNGLPFPMPITVRECLRDYCDITISPRRSDLKLLASYATDPLDQKALLRLSSKDGKAEYREKILDGYIGLVQLLQLCPSIQMSLESFLSFVPLLHPRYYTISSSSSLHPNTVHITVAVTEATRHDGSTFQGVCTGYLSKQSVGKTLRVFNRPSSFRLPKDPSKPIIMIGPGTGIAPMRALLQERSYQNQQMELSASSQASSESKSESESQSTEKKNSNKTIGSNILYFGCKRRDQDYLYEQELLDYQSKGILNELYVAFSRENIPTTGNDSGSIGKKTYVQHLLANHAMETWDLVHEQDAYIYVCGGVKMGHDVFETLQQIISKQGNMSMDDAKDYLHKLSTVGRFVQELWA